MENSQKLMTLNKGTELYIAPERIASEHYNFKVDVYS